MLTDIYFILEYLSLTVCFIVFLFHILCTPLSMFEYRQLTFYRQGTLIISLVSVIVDVHDNWVIHICAYRVIQTGIQVLCLMCFASRLLSLTYIRINEWFKHFVPGHNIQIPTWSTVYLVLLNWYWRRLIFFEVRRSLLLELIWSWVYLKWLIILITFILYFLKLSILSSQGIFLGCHV